MMKVAHNYVTYYNDILQLSNKNKENKYSACYKSDRKVIVLQPKYIYCVP